ncbi:hypothetical protein IQ266_21815 [filamentous cyanobacterium LEGE 11480]|uniref:Uncharacterized protein n=1 Tax=Romeriopsis navalis LEGE 11480 TaxID=2777977 RepID=A0A928VUM4_9CYAN|nr:hypothetical protein [Romeriopsis navalis]MBE9032379.1 hypothetical protein [Romeriopsis navalis LEGE 11480]
MNQTPLYMDKHCTQTLREGLAEYYALNPHVTDPGTQPSDFGQILRAHDAGHVIYGCDTGMSDELKILPLFWWTSKCTFRTYLQMKNSPAVDVMYEDMIREKGSLWLYGAVFRVLPGVILELIPVWFKTRNRQKLVPFLEFEPLLDRALVDIRQEFDLLPFMK